MTEYTRRTAGPSMATPVAVTPPDQKPSQKVVLPEPMIITKASGLPQAQTTPDAEVDIKVKRIKTPSGVKKARQNKRLAKMLQPKPALMLLHEIKPGITFTIQEPPNPTSGVFLADAVHDGKVLGCGSGKSKNGAKQNAAEVALKQIVRETMTNPLFLSSLTKESLPSKVKIEDGAMENDGNNETEDGIAETPYEKLPWAALASFALHRMFAEWNEDGIVISPAVNPLKPAAYTAVEDLKIPDNAHLMHPVSLLNQMHPGIKGEELQRTQAPNSSVTFGFRIDGQLYSGTGTNRKAARKIAANHAVQAVYGISCT